MAGNNLDPSGKTVTEPWEPLQEPLRGLIGSAGNLFNETMTRNAGGTDRDISGLGVTTPGLYGGLRGQMAPAYGDLYGAAGAPGAAETWLTGTARGDYLGGSPGLEGVMSGAVDPAINQLKSMYAAAGRGFSGAMNDDMMRTAGGIRSNILNQNYQAERDRQIAAAGTLESAQQNRLGLRRGILGDRYANELSALNGQTQAEATRTSLQPILDELTTWDPRWDAMQRYGELLGTASPYQTQTKYEPAYRKWLELIGGISGIVRPFLR